MVLCKLACNRRALGSESPIDSGKRRVSMFSTSALIPRVFVFFGPLTSSDLSSHLIMILFDSICSLPSAQIAVDCLCRCWCDPVWWHLGAGGRLVSWANLDHLTLILLHFSPSSWRLYMMSDKSQAASPGLEPKTRFSFRFSRVAPGQLPVYSTEMHEASVWYDLQRWYASSSHIDLRIFSMLEDFIGNLE